MNGILPDKKMNNLTKLNIKLFHICLYHCKDKTLNFLVITYKTIRLFPVRLRTCRAFITELRIEHSLHVQISTFPMWSKSGPSTVPALYPYCAANFGLKYRKTF